VTIDPNNRPGGRSLIVTCKSANKIQFFDVGALTRQVPTAAGCEFAISN
jgi:hypothetical protein